MKLSRTCLAALAFSGLGAPSACLAQGLDIGVTTGYPNNQIIYGCMATYSLTGSPPPGTQITGVRWRYSTPNCQPPWSDWLSGGYSQSYYETLVGAFTVQAEVTYQAQPTPQNPNPPKQTTVLSKAVTVPKPDGVQLPSPASIIVDPAPVAVGGPPDSSVALFAFPITCQGVVICNGSRVSSVKENITEHMLGNIKIEDDDLVGDPDKLYVTATTVYDKKWFAVRADPTNLGIFDTYTQEIIVYISDCCGNTKDYSLGTVKVSSATMIDPNGNPKIKITVSK